VQDTKNLPQISKKICKSYTISAFRLSAWLSVRVTQHSWTHLLPWMWGLKEMHYPRLLRCGKVYIQHAHEHTRPRTNTRTNTRTNARTHEHTHERTNTRTHEHTNTRTHEHTNTRTLTRKHTILASAFSYWHIIISNTENLVNRI
jgi:hypothetical protein